MVLSVIGFNHRTATLAEREPFQLQRRELGEATLLYKRLSGVSECLVLATCNRVECYRVDGKRGHPGQEMVEFYRQRGVTNPDSILPCSYRHVGAGAARHLFRVISGMDSLVLGEEQIPGQVKEAYSAACGVGGPGKVLHKLFHFAFRVSKQVRSETRLGDGIRSVPGAAVELMMQTTTRGMTAVVLGADATSEVILNHLAQASVRTILLSRTHYNAQKMAAAYGVESAPWEDLTKVVAEADLLFSATGARDPVLLPEMITDRSDRPLRIADLAVPRDVAPSVGELPGVEILDLQDLKYHLERIAGDRCAQLPEAQEIVEQQVDGFLEWLHAQVFVGGIDAIRQEMHQIAQEETKRYRDSFHAGQMKALEAFSHALLKRFLKAAVHHFEPDGVPTDTIMARLDPAAIEFETPQNGTAASLPGRQEMSCRERRAAGKSMGKDQQTGGSEERGD